MTDSRIEISLIICVTFFFGFRVLSTNKPDYANGSTYGEWASLPVSMVQDIYPPLRVFPGPGFSLRHTIAHAQDP